MSTMADRRAQYKSPPVASQESRRQQALEEQKRRRAQRIDSSRNLDLFAGLTLGPSDDEADAGGGAPAPEPEPLRGGLAAYLPLLGAESGVPLARPASTSSMSTAPGTDGGAPGAGAGVSAKGRRKRRAGKAPAHGHGHGAPKPSKWADKCMYAELLEMRADAPWGNDAGDGLPSDLESGWVALAPVPAGKRCLVVTYQSSGVAGNVPNTHLRSRLLGKSLVRPFPSPLPAHTILDCVLDEHWRATGLLHVLDVVKWKSQDVGDCETAFRFWFRDARLSELPAPTPPLALRAPAADPAVPAPAPAIEPAYRFPYPCTFLPVPYTTDTSLPALLSSVIPAARAVRALDLLIPRAVPAPAESDGAMAPAPGPSTLVPAAPGALQHFAAARGAAAVRPDGLLLYVREAAYEPGASPLSSWVPVELAPPPGGEAPRPLDLFEWLVRRRAAAGGAPAADGEAMVE